jgi:pimeloyl-ACP methyl ester carboxylesterase
VTETTIHLDDGTRLAAFVDGPKDRGTVVFAHGSGSSRHSSRNQHVAASLRERGLRTVLADLLTPPEERVDVRTAEHRFDIDLLTARVAGLVDWAVDVDEANHVGLFGASTGAAAALRAAAERPERVHAIVSRGGRPDLAGALALGKVAAPTLLVVGGEDQVVLDLNRVAAGHLRCPHALEIVPGATHLFPEPGALDRVAELAGAWFEDHLGP